MTTIDLREFESTFVIHFGGTLHRINAYTLATTLVGIADAAKAANAVLNPGHEIEIVVDAFAPGSFKATVRALYTQAGNLFSKNDVKAVALGVIASFVYQHTLAPSTNVVVTVNESDVVITQGDIKILVSREVHVATELVAQSPHFRKGVADAVRAVDSDPAVVSLGFSPRPEDLKPPMDIPRERFAALPRYLAEPESDERVLEEITDLRILRAILERSKRRWEFVWNGIRIPAPVLDDNFYSAFFAHKIKIAPGDFLRVRLRVRQRKDPDLGIFLNHSYEVIEVLDHRPQTTHPELSESQD